VADPARRGGELSPGGRGNQRIRSRSRQRPTRIRALWDLAQRRLRGPSSHLPGGPSQARGDDPPHDSPAAGAIAARGGSHGRPAQRRDRSDGRNRRLACRRPCWQSRRRRSDERSWRLLPSRARKRSWAPRSRPASTSRAWSLRRPLGGVRDGFAGCCDLRVQLSRARPAGEKLARGSKPGRRAHLRSSRRPGLRRGSTPAGSKATPAPRRTSRRAWPSRRTPSCWSWRETGEAFGPIRPAISPRPPAEMVGDGPLKEASAMDKPQPFDHLPEVLDEQACQFLLQSRDLGRLAFNVGGREEIFPVNYAVEGRIIVFRTAPAPSSRRSPPARWRSRLTAGTQSWPWVGAWSSGAKRRRSAPISVGPRSTFAGRRCARLHLESAGTGWRSSHPRSPGGGSMCLQCGVSAPNSRRATEPEAN